MQLRAANESVYKHSLELAVKNKTLSLLDRLYEIATLALEGKEMASRMTSIIQKEFDFEVVGMLAFREKDGTVEPLAFTVSKQVESVESEHAQTLGSSLSGVVTRFACIKKAIFEKQMVYTEDFATLCDGTEQKNVCHALSQKGFIRSSLVYPLVVNDKTIGVLVLSLNRVHSEIVAYEQEAMRSFVSVIAIALDKVLLYEALQQANTQLKLLDRQKSEFLSIASHQLRTPLTAIKWSAGAILENSYGDVPKNLHDPLQTIYEESALMAVFINDYLNISRIEQGRMEYHFAEMDVLATLRAVVSEMRPAVGAKGLKFVSTIGDEKALMWGDGGKLTQVFSNIIDNAIKYTPAGGITVSAKKAPDGSTVRVEIQDTGIGIAPETLHTLFEKFTRGQNASDVNSAGSGLGLYVARTFVQAHKGRVWPESEGEGKGTTFVIELPLLTK